MQYRRLGRTGLKVSEVGLGCNNFGMRLDAPGTLEVVSAAIDQGITLFDTADIYGNTRSETFLGAALGARRQQVVVATKFGLPVGKSALERGGSRRYIHCAVEASLKRLNTDYIDLYQIHMPDPDTPIEETLDALTDLVRAGKVRYTGCCNFSAWQIADADWTARSGQALRFATAQNAYSLLDRGVEREVLPACERYGLGFLPYFPLASGMLTGKYRRGAQRPAGARLENPEPWAEHFLADRNFERVERLEQFAQARGHGLLDLAFGWLLAQPLVASVIAGATSAEQVAANAAAGGWRLSAAEFSEAGTLAGN
ncbi:MAG: aldo/keto reductase [Gammaproteobacteria bacterium]